MDLSNKTLAMFLVAAIVVSIAGTTVSLNRLGALDRVGVTGYATTDTGNLTLTVSSNTSIEFVTSYNLLNWGTGTVDGDNNCTLVTDGTTTGCLNFDAVSNGLLLRNIGNVNVTVQLVSNATNPEFLDSSGECTAEAADVNFSTFLYKVTVNETGACNSTPVPSAFTTPNVTSDGTTICDVLRFEEAYDDLNISFSLSFHANCTKGGKIAVMTAKATAV